MSDSAPEKPKIIIDEDWKSQVQREREEAAAGQSSQPVAAGGDTAAAGPDAAGAEVELPPASFAGLLTMLATQALASLGQVPDPATGQPMVHLPLASHFIDLLAMLEEKTRGNLAADEAAMLSNVLHDLRLAYVAVRKQASEGTAKS